MVIEEDGKTEEEFIEGLTELQQELESFANQANELQRCIANNLSLLLEGKL